MNTPEPRNWLANSVSQQLPSPIENRAALEAWQLYSLPAELACAIARSVLPCVGPEMVRHRLDGAAPCHIAPAKSAHLSKSTVT
jgi:hypothetical protein